MMKREQIPAQGEWRVLATNKARGTVIYRTDKKTSPAPQKDRSREKAEAAAVYTYLKAVRALGKRRVTTTDVAGALGLSEREVRRIMSSMEDRGVRAG